MISFDVAINGKRQVVAGIPGYAVLAAHVTWVKRRAHPPEMPTETSSLEFDVGGLDSNSPLELEHEHKRWLNRPLKVGDSVRIRVVEKAEVESPPESDRVMTPAELHADRLSSCRHYLKLYRQQQRQLARIVKEHERSLKKLLSEARSNKKR